MPESQPSPTIHPLPYKSHPIWPLRRLTLLWSGLGFLFALFSFGALWIFLALSLLFVLYDLMTWAIQKAKLSINGPHRCPNTSCPHQQSTTIANRDDGDDEPQDPMWPRRFLLVVDAILAILLQIVFWVALTNLSFTYYYSNSAIVIQSYTLLPVFVTSLLHGKAFWKELMARKKKEWLESMPSKPCPACGFVAPVAVESRNGNTPLPSADDEDALPRWAKTFNKKSRGRRDDLESGMSASSMDSEDGLLIAPTPEGSNENTLRRYGTLNQSVHSLAADGEEVVRKKKSKRVIGENWLGKGSGSTNKGKGKVVETSKEIPDLPAPLPRTYTAPDEDPRSSNTTDDKGVRDTGDSFNEDIFEQLRKKLTAKQQINRKAAAEDSGF